MNSTICSKLWNIIVNNKTAATVKCCLLKCCDRTNASDAPTAICILYVPWHQMVAVNRLFFVIFFCVLLLPEATLNVSSVRVDIWTGNVFQNLGSILTQVAQYQYFKCGSQTRQADRLYTTICTLVLWLSKDETIKRNKKLLTFHIEECYNQFFESTKRPCLLEDKRTVLIMVGHSSLYITCTQHICTQLVMIGCHVMKLQVTIHFPRVTHVHTQ